MSAAMPVTLSSVSNNEYYPAVTRSKKQFQKMGILEATSLVFRITHATLGKIQGECIQTHYAQGVFKEDAPIPLSGDLTKSNSSLEKQIFEQIGQWKTAQYPKNILEMLWKSLGEGFLANRSKHLPSTAPAVLTETFQEMISGEQNLLKRWIPSHDAAYLTQLREMGIIQAVCVRIFVNEPTPQAVDGQCSRFNFHFDQCVSQSEEFFSFRRDQASATTASAGTPIALGTPLSTDVAKASGSGSGAGAQHLPSGVASNPVATASASASASAAIAPPSHQPLPLKSPPGIARKQPSPHAVVSHPAASASASAASAPNPSVTAQSNSAVGAANQSLSLLTALAVASEGLTKKTRKDQNYTFTAQNSHSQPLLPIPTSVLPMPSACSDFNNTKKRGRFAASASGSAASAEVSPTTRKV
jgi:hypothetical protein